jgi:hypothetical protein
VDLWTDARRRQGALEDAGSGTRLEYVIESLIERGWSKERPWENEQSVSKDAAMPPLFAELDAFDKRQKNLRHHSIAGSDRTRQVVEALARGHGVVFGTGVKNPYFYPRRNTVLGPEALGGDENGHAQRIRGYSTRRSAFVVQNSWGSYFGGVEWEDGRDLDGCVFVSPQVIEEAWDIEVFENVK